MTRFCDFIGRICKESNYVPSLKPAANNALLGGSQTVAVANVQSSAKDTGSSTGVAHHGGGELPIWPLIIIMSYVNLVISREPLPSGGVDVSESDFAYDRRPRIDDVVAVS